MHCTAQHASDPQKLFKQTLGVLHKQPMTNRVLDQSKCGWGGQRELCRDLWGWTVWNFAKL